MPCQEYPKNQPPANAKGGPFKTKTECQQSIGDGGCPCCTGDICGEGKICCASAEDSSKTKCQYASPCGGKSPVCSLCIFYAPRGYRTLTLGPYSGYTDAMAAAGNAATDCGGTSPLATPCIVDGVATEWYGFACCPP